MKKHKRMTLEINNTLQDKYRSQFYTMIWRFVHYSTLDENKDFNKERLQDELMNGRTYSFNVKVAFK